MFSRRAPLFVAVVFALGAMLVASACEPTNARRVPDPGPTVPAKWKNLRPDVANVAYGPHASHRADIYLPSRGNRGVIVLVHGGGFFAGNRQEVADTTGLVMAQTDRGFAVVNVSYRLLNGTSNAFPAAVRDVDLAVRWVRAHGRDHGLNPHTVVVAGGSAGGTLAALVGTGWNSNPVGALGRTERVDGWVAFAGIMDFTAPGRTAAVDAIGKAWLGRNAVHPAWFSAASPVSHLDRNDPPGYLVQGDRDTTVERGQVNRMIDAAARAGSAPSRLHYDIVDTGPVACRGHSPACGAAASTFNSWLDQVVGRKL